MRSPIQQLAPSFTSARAYRDWKNSPVLITAEEVLATVTAAPDPYQHFETRINGYHVDLEIDEDCGDIVSQCTVTLKFVNSSHEYCSSLAVIENEGTIESDDGDNIRPVAQATIDKIVKWAYANGY